MLNLKHNSMSNNESTKGEIVMYQPDETIRLEVRVESETVWLTQQQMAELFLTTKQNVSLHVNNIFKEDELTENSVVKESLTTRVTLGAYIDLITLLNCPKLDWNLLEQQRARWVACQNTRQLELFTT